MTKYREYKQLDLPAIGKEELQRWEQEKTFEESVNSRQGRPSFTFYEGPPSANGLPGIHHVMARAIKDIFCRYKTLKGFQVKRKGGWDTHGLPIEISVEKTLGIRKDDIGKKISVEDYNKACRKEVMKYKDVWDDLTRKMGYWVDLEHPYITYENSYIETCWYLLKEFYKKDLLYKGYTIQPFSPAAGTGLSSHELNQPGTYKDVKDTTVVAQFEIPKSQVTSHKFFAKHQELAKEPVYFLAWTTTPWTLPSNTALAVGKNISYVAVRTFNPYTHQPIAVILAKDLFGKYFSEKNAALKLEDYNAGDKQIPFAVAGEFKGQELEGMRYEQLLPYAQPADGDAFKVVLGDFVTTEDGTGIVHIAPSFGADDFRTAKLNGLGSLTLVDRQGRFTPEVSDFAGEYVKEQYYTDTEKEAERIRQGGDKYLTVDERIAIKLKKENKAFKVEKYEHTYPHCWRTDKPILYYPLDSWFIRTTACKDRMIELNKTINWKPESTGTGRFGNWLENLVDWNLSRSRYWGIPLPVWRTEDGSEEICIGSIDELKSEIEKSIAAGFMDPSHLEHVDASKPDFDLHRPYVDHIILVSGGGQKMFRESDLIDVWFDSGAMPYAQWHWPFGPLATEGGGPVPALMEDAATYGMNQEGEVLSVQEEEAAYRWKTANPSLYAKISQHARDHRRSPTPAEETLWDQLSGKKLEGYKFRREHIIGGVIVDFLCLAKKLVIEVDGDYHESPEQIGLDKIRTDFLNSLGYQVIRFTNDEVNNDIERVLNKIVQALAHLPIRPKQGDMLPPFGGQGAGFPADFIAEGVDQTRGWFFTLHAIAAMLFDSVAYKNVVSNGLVLDKNGNKMSKRLGNAADPFDVISKYGADATRWYMISNAQPWDNLRFNEEGIGEVLRKFFGTLYNTYSFFSLYANIDGFAYAEKDIPVSGRPEIDRWILSELHSLVRVADESYADYEPTRAARAIQDFVTEHLSNWYVRLCRRRFWKGNYSDDKVAAYQTLYTCLETVARLMSPIAPFFADRLFTDLNSVSRKTPVASVHLAAFPVADSAVIDSELEERMELAQKLSSMVLSLRKKVNIRVRQPLGRILVPVLDERFRTQVESVKDLVLAEVNVKELEYMSDTSGILVKKIKPNFKVLGKKAGALMKEAAAAIQALDQENIRQMEKEGRFMLMLNGQSLMLENEDVEILSEDIPGWQVASDGKLTVALDIHITEPLREEGIAREFINRIQNLRKEKGFEVTDKIGLKVLNHASIKTPILNNKEYICAEILAASLEIVDHLQDAGAVNIAVDDTVSTLVAIYKN